MAKALRTRIWRLTPSGDLAFAPGEVGPVSLTDPRPVLAWDAVAQADAPVGSMNGTVVRSQMCETGENVFSDETEDGGCRWKHEFSTRPDYHQDRKVCVKFKYFYDREAAITSFNGGSDDNGVIHFPSYSDVYFTPNFESGAFDDKSYVIGWNLAERPYTLNGVGMYYQINMRDLMKENTVKFKGDSTTELAEDSKLQAPIFCNRMNSVSIGTVVVFSFTMILWIGRMFSLTEALDAPLCA